MSITWMMVLKYLSWMLTVGTAFVGSWFVEYTTTDRETGRRKLTMWGRRGIFLAGSGLVCSLALTLWTDYDTAYKQKNARDNEERYQRELKTIVADFKSLVTAISEASLSREANTAVGQAVIKFKGIEDYQLHYPELYSSLITPTWFVEITQAINNAVAGRISNEPECVAAISKDDSGPFEGAFPTGHFLLGESAMVTFMITSDDVRFGFSDASNLNSLGNGKYKFMFADGSESLELQCTVFNTGMSCQDKTSDSTARQVFANLQLKSVKAIKANNKIYEVSESVAKAILKTFSCISP